MKMFLAALALTASCFAGGCSKGESLGTAEFDKQIAEGVVLVDFWASWCAPCRAQGPILADVAEEVKEFAKVVKLNVDDEVEVASEYGIRSIPTLILFKDGGEQKRFQGVTDANTLVSALKAAR